MNRYNIIEQTGEQATGTIYFGENKETLEKVIIKKYKKKFYTWSDCMALREIKVLRTFNHLNIVKLKELIKENNVLYSIYEYMDQNLYDYYQTLRDSNTYLQETEIKSIMHQIFQALHYSHKNQFFHRDLSLENVFINHDTQQVKVSNFQAAREMNAKGQLTDYITTRWYRAPEQLLHSASYNYKIDCWAAACIMAELYLLGPLFPGNSESDQLFRIIKILGTPKDWPDFHNLMLNMTKNKGQTPVYEPQELAYIIPQASVEAIDLLKRLFIYNPQNRFSAAQALNHPYFTGISLQQYKMQLTNQNSFLSPSNSRSNQQHTGQNQEKQSKSQFNKQGKLNQVKDQDQVEEDPNEYLTSPTKKIQKTHQQRLQQK
ncbi:Protein kinase-like domain [Pseudocohnilembus persalinus]|uniref:Protein kinase-like domain n=1 Tax=Pseudocohnilembus persalinus TaxID=266149 RepID=A0A0V0QB87_PSEPJ|nr:Protein kinase-like domain [Pseudocohnilembus persalinus]|eukprot:KRW99456.1 Protein kinase-like domain [Pseudocohnilembus persalinus]